MNFHVNGSPSSATKTKKTAKIRPKFINDCTFLDKRNRYFGTFTLVKIPALPMIVPIPPLVASVKKENIKILESTLKKQRFVYRSALSWQEYEIQMSGRFQTENGAEAVAAVRELIRQGYIIEESAITRGLLKAVLPGRFQVIQNENPIVLIDGAHNPGAAFRLRENITFLLREYHIIFIMGIFADKDYEKVVEITCDLADNIYTVKSDGKRALDAKILAECIKTHGKEACSAESVPKALELAVSKAEELTARTKRKSAVICFGSFSFLKYIKTAVEDRRRNNEN